jgi:hypothetical protein
VLAPADTARCPAGATFATAPDNLWLAGEAGYVLQWNGTGAPIRITRGSSATGERSCAGSARRLTPEPSPIAGELTAIHGAGGTMWIASNELGSDGMVGVLQRSSAGWVQVAVPHLLSADAIFATGARDVRIAGANNAGMVPLGRHGVHPGVDAIRRQLRGGVPAPGGSLWLAGDNAILQRTP